MVKFVKRALIIIFVLTIAPLITSCDNNKNQNNHTHKDAIHTSRPSTIADKVNLIMYLVGTKPKDTDLVYQKVNEKMLKDINATVQPRFIEWSDIPTKYPLIFSSGEDFDLIFVSTWAIPDYVSIAKQNVLYELKQDFIKQYIPLALEKVPEEAWKQAKVDGKIYTVPPTYIDVVPWYFIIRGDLRIKYGLPKVKTLSDLENFYDAVKKNDPEMLPLDLGKDDWWKPLFGIYNTMNSVYEGIRNTPFAMNKFDKGTKIFSVFDDPRYKTAIDLMNKWYKKGYWSIDSLVKPISVKDSFLNGTSASCFDKISVINELYSRLQKSHPDWKLEYYEPALETNQKLSPALYINNAIAINANSKNPERAMMALNLFMFNREYFDLTTYGILGKHYELVGEKYKMLPEGINFGAEMACSWGWKNEEFVRERVDANPDYKGLYEAAKRRIELDIIKKTGFNADNTSIPTESQILKDFCDTVIKAASLGLMPFDEAKQKYEYIYEKAAKKALEEYNMQWNKAKELLK